MWSFQAQRFTPIHIHQSINFFLISFKDMAKLVFYLLLLISFHCMAGTAESSNTPSPTNFIKASCKATRYPSLCVQCLSSYAAKIQQNQKQLVEAALTVSLSRAQSAAAFVSRMSKTSGTKTQAMKDCAYNVGNSVFQLKRSIQELGQVGDQAASQDFVWHMSNVQTWVSTALTNCNTCIDGFAAGPAATAAVDGNVKDAIKSRVVDVAQVTSNALALISRYAARHRLHRAAAAATTNNSP